MRQRRKYKTLTFYFIEFELASKACMQQIKMRGNNKPYIIYKTKSDGNSHTISNSNQYQWQYTLKRKKNHAYIIYYNKGKLTSCFIESSQKAVGQIKDRQNKAT